MSDTSNVMTLHLPKLAFCLLSAFAIPHALYAQSPDPVESARFHVGPVGLTPSIAFRNVGIDGNVFRAAEDPKRDYMFTFSPGVTTWLRAGDSRLEVRSRTDFVYYHRYSGERSVDGDVSLRWGIPWNRLTPWVTAEYMRARQRAGYEIDLRSRRTRRQYGGGIDLRLTPKASVSFSVGEARHGFDPDKFFRGSSLQEMLNRETRTVSAEYRHSATPLTTVVVDVQRFQDRFQFFPQRDTDSFRVSAGFDLDRDALISGHGRVGFRRLDSIDPHLPGFDGVVTQVEAGSTLFGRARLAVAAGRDLNYSAELLYPHYVQTGALVTVTPRLTERWDVQIRAEAQRLAYRSAAIPSLVTGRIDRYRLLGAGAGFWLGPDLRFGFNADHERRESPLLVRTYEGYRIGTSVTYER